MIRPDPRQFDLFATLAPIRAPAIIRQVEPHGHVVQGKIDEELTLPHPRMAWPLAKIELHQHTDGLWMWATCSHDNDGSGGGYRVGAKWGHFAATRDDALFYAATEIRERTKSKGKAATAIHHWLDGLVN